MFSSFHEMRFFASGSTKPPGTNAFVSASNSRTMAASPPPFERFTRHFLRSGKRQLAPWYTKLSCSALPSASMSSSVVHVGFGVLKSASVVCRQSPRGCSESVQKLRRWSRCMRGDGMRSFEL